ARSRPRAWREPWAWGTRSRGRSPCAGEGATERRESGEANRPPRSVLRRDASCAATRRPSGAAPLVEAQREQGAAGDGEHAEREHDIARLAAVAGAGARERGGAGDAGGRRRAHLRGGGAAGRGARRGGGAGLRRGRGGLAGVGGDGGVRRG